MHIVVDTGAIVALLRESDRHHAATVKAFRNLRVVDRLHTTWPVVTECAFVLHDQGGRLWAWLAASTIEVAEFDLKAAFEMQAWARRYRDRQVDFADASVVWLADRLKTRKVMTTDFRDFLAYRLRSGKPLDLLIEPATTG